MLNEAAEIAFAPVRDWEWVPLWRASTNRFRVSDPAILPNPHAMKPLFAAVLEAMTNPDVVGTVDRQFSSWAEALRFLVTLGRVNAADRGALAVYAVQGAAITHAELNSTPLREKCTHPQWHIVFDYFENEAGGEAGPAGVIALNAAHRAYRMSIPWDEPIMDSRLRSL